MNDFDRIMNDFDRLLHEAAKKAEDAMTSDFTAPDEIHSFSPDFEAKMVPLLRKQTRPVKRALQQAACFALVILMGCTLYLGTDTEAQERFAGLLEIIESGGFTHSYLNDADDSSSPQHEPTVNVHALDDYREIRTMDECHALLSEAGLRNTDDVDPPYAVVHCESSAGTGWYVQTLLMEHSGEDVRACIHGNEDMIDVRSVTMRTYRGSCTRCFHQNIFNETIHGEWTCKLP